MTDTTVRLPDEVDEPLAPMSTAPDQALPARSMGPLRSAWRQLTSMRTALVLLFLLALAAVPGSLLPQRGLNLAKVRDFYSAHPTLAPWLDRLSLFDVFAAPWFAAIYLLLFVSLVGCLTPRLRLHLRAMRTSPPPAPRRLSRLPAYAQWDVDGSAADTVRAAADVLRGERFRVVVRDDDRGMPSVAAEKGYLRETGNLLFHGALLVLLVAVALGGLFGYKGNVLVTEGDGFANVPSSYDDFRPARLFSDSSMAPLSVTLDQFRATYTETGQPLTFTARVHYRSAADAPDRPAVIRVNHPLSVDGVKVYLIGHGYAPHVTVRDAQGHVAFSAAVPFLQRDAMFTSDGVIKVPDALPEQLGLTGFFVPTASADPARGVVSTYPAPRRPVLVLTAYHGDLGLDSGRPQSVWSLDTDKLTQFTLADGRPATKALRPGDTWTLPDGSQVTFDRITEFATFQVTHDPGNGLALLAAVLIVGGLLLSLRVRRRRVWVRGRPADPEGADGGTGRTVVEVAGLPRTDAESFATEFTGLDERLRATLGARATED